MPLFLVADRHEVVFFRLIRTRVILLPTQKPPTYIFCYYGISFIAEEWVLIGIEKLTATRIQHKPPHHFLQ